MAEPRPAEPPAVLRPDGHRPGGWTLLVDGVEQSYVDTSDPTHLEFEYMRRLAAVIDAAAPAGRPVRVLHLGGGAYTLPRYVAATRPGSAQVIVEHDPALAAQVAAGLPPVPGDVEIVIADARDAVEEAGPDRFDLVIADVYRAAEMPSSVAGVEFAAGVARLLRPGGTYAVNVADRPPLAFTRVQVATLRAVLPDVCLLADPGLLRGRRYGNAVLAASRAPGGLPVARLARTLAGQPFPARLVHGADLDRFVAGAKALDDATVGAAR